MTRILLRTLRCPRGDAPALLVLASIMMTMTGCAPETASIDDNMAVADRSSSSRPSDTPDVPPAAPGQAATPAPAATPPVERLALDMPEALRGAWRADDLGRAPTANDCNQTSASNRNFGKVLTIRPNGYSLFEEGGRVIRVYARASDSIDAQFDTTYADTPTTARFAFALRAGERLAVTDKGGGDRMLNTVYRRCAS